MSLNAPAPPDPARWSDSAFLDRLRADGDAAADATLRELLEEGGEAEVDAVSQIFRLMSANHQPLPADAPAPFVAFVNGTCEPPSWMDPARIERGEAVYLRHAFTISLVLLAKSLPEGYSAPTLTHILQISGNLEHHPYSRLMGVLQMIVNVCNHGFQGGCRAIVTAQKLRLLHAGVRHVADKVVPGYRERFGFPVNHEDMLATIMGFSWLVIEGLQRLKVDLTDEEAEDLYYLWRVFAQQMGIHPAGAPDDPTYVPESLAAAKTFYKLYGERHFTGPEENPEGVILTRHNLTMMQELIPRPLRWLGLGALPAIYMEALMTPEARARVGVPPVRHHHLMKAIFLWLPRVFQSLEDKVSPHAAEHFGAVVFQRMIDRNRGGEVTFLIPDSVSEMLELA